MGTRDLYFLLRCRQLLLQRLYTNFLPRLFIRLTRGRRAKRIIETLFVIKKNLEVPKFSKDNKKINFFLLLICNFKAILKLQINNKKTIID